MLLSHSVDFVLMAVVLIVSCTAILPPSCVHRDSSVPQPPAGHRWKEVRHDNTVTWLASWTENVQGSVKYIMLNANSKLKVREKQEGSDNASR